MHSPTHFVTIAFSFYLIFQFISHKRNDSFFLQNFVHFLLFPSYTLLTPNKLSVIIKSFQNKSTTKAFKKSVKLVKVTKNSTVSSTISKLTKKKTYYVRIRSYKTVSGTPCCSAWSAAKSVKITK